MTPQEEIEFRKKYNERNKLRKEINTKKQFLAKLVNIPECLAETLTLKSEIEALEKELDSLN